MRARGCRRIQKIKTEKFIKAIDYSGVREEDADSGRRNNRKVTNTKHKLSRLGSTINEQREIRLPSVFIERNKRKNHEEESHSIVLL